MQEARQIGLTQPAQRRRLRKGVAEALDHTHDFLVATAHRGFSLIWWNVLVVPFLGAHERKWHEGIDRDANIVP